MLKINFVHCFKKTKIFLIVGRYVFLYNFRVNNVSISIVIPSYNEMANLQKGVLDKIDHYVSRKKFSCEIIVVDDGSTDGSREFVEKFARENPEFKILKNNHLGKAGAVTEGVLRAKGDYILFTDMDQATPIEELEKLLPFVENGYDVVIGSRNKVRKGSPFTRQLMSNSVIFLRKLLVGIHSIYDTQCGFKLFSRKSATDIFTKVKEIHSGYQSIHGSSVTAGFDIELLYLAVKHGYRIKEVPVDWLYVESRRVSPIKDSIEGLLDLIKIRMNIIKGIYK